MSSIGGHSLISTPPLSFGLRIWVSQRAQMLAGQQRFGAAEHDRLKQIVKTRFPELMMSRGRAADVALQYLMIAILSEALAKPGVGRPLQLDLQPVLQDYSQAVATISRIVKAEHDAALTILSNMKA